MNGAFLFLSIMSSVVLLLAPWLFDGKRWARDVALTLWNITAIVTITPEVESAVLSTHAQCVSFDPTCQSSP